MSKRVRNVLEIIFCLLFILTGCSIDSIFTGSAVEWFIAFVVLVAVAFVIGGNGNE